MEESAEALCSHDYLWSFYSFYPSWLVLCKQFIKQEYLLRHQNVDHVPKCFGVYMVQLFLAVYCFTDVCIVGVARTPIGGFLGTLSSLSATKLGSIAIEG